MSKELTDIEKIELMITVGAKLKDFTKSYVVAIYGAFHDNTGELIGSGTLLKHEEKKMVLTANHVVQKALSSTYVTPALSPKINNKPYEFGKEHLIWSDNDLDVAIFRHPSPDNIPSTYFLDSSKIDYSVGNIKNDMLFIHGFPGVKSRFIPFNEPGVHSATMPYTTVEGKSKYRWYNEDDFFAIEYLGQGQKDELGKIADLPIPMGLSGSSVWAARLNSTNTDSWLIDSAKMVGVIHNWDDKCQSIVATKIEKFREKLTSI